MRLTHLGHAGVLVESDVHLLIDPGTACSFDDVEGLDAVLVTHQHADHLDLSRLAALFRRSPGARLVVDEDTRPVVRGRDGLPEPEIARPGDRLTVGRTRVDVVGGRHEAVHGDVPGCTNVGYLLDDGAFLHPGDSWVRPPGEIDVLAVPVDGPWLKLGEAVDYVHATAPRRAVPVHDGATTDPGKLHGLLSSLCPAGRVRPLRPGLGEVV